MMKTPVDRRGILAAAAAGSVVAALPARAEDLPPIRRLVTAEAETGRSTILFDSAPPISVELNGSTIGRHWKTAGVSAPGRCAPGEPGLTASRISLNRRSCDSNPACSSA